MEELGDDQVKRALTEALSALSRARAATKNRPQIVQARSALTSAVQSFDPAPAPSPFPTDKDDNPGP
jgi:hypothetical protein